MLISLIIVLIVIGVGLYLLNTLVPMDPRIRTLINAVVLICVLLYVLSSFGLIGNVPLLHGRVL